MFIVLAIEVMQGYYVSECLPSLPWETDWECDDAPERASRTDLDQAELVMLHMAAIVEYPCS